MERFDLREDGMVFDYRPSPQYRMRLTVKTGPSFHADPPPQVAIWLENYIDDSFGTALDLIDSALLTIE